MLQKKRIYIYKLLLRIGSKCNQNQFIGDDVLDSFNTAFRDEDSILDQMYAKQLISDFFYEDLKFSV